VADTDKLISFFGIGSGSDAARRFVQFVTPKLGWAGFVADYILPQIDQGVRRFMLWMPHGREAALRKQRMGTRWITTNLRFDAYLLAKKNPANSWLTKGFAEAFYPITTSGIEIIAYVGALHGAPEFDSYPVSEAKWQAMKAIAPLLDARCSIALDTSVFSTPGHYLYEFAKTIKSAGFNYYLEPTPHVGYSHWYGSSCVVSNDQWKVVENPGSHYLLASPKLLQGEVIRGWFEAKPDFYPGYREWYNWTVPPAIAAGQSCCLHLGTYLKAGGKLDDLIH
jgi:hypothetical protein